MLLDPFNGSTVCTHLIGFLSDDRRSKGLFEGDRPTPLSDFEKSMQRPIEECMNAHADSRQSNISSCRAAYSTSLRIDSTPDVYYRKRK